MKDIRLHDEVAAKLAAMAVRQGETIEATADCALREYFSEKEEEEQRWQETLEAAAQMDRGEGIDGEKVLAWLKSWGTGRELPPP